MRRRSLFEVQDMKYASKTTVAADRSRNEIERTLKRYGADQFAYGWGEDKAMIGFRMNGKFIRFELPLSKREDFACTPTGRRRSSQTATEEAWDQAVRQSWRALALLVKAKLESVESGITVFEEEFMAHIVMPDGRTVSEWATPQIEQAYETGKVPPLLSAGTIQ